MARREGDLVERYFRPHSFLHEGAFGLLDDAALLTPPPGAQLVLTADALVCGVHFLADDPAESIAVKAFSVNISDLVAKGATPYAYLLTLALPASVDDPFLESFSRGLARVCEGRLIGGDLVATDGPMTLSITAIGLVGERGMVRRGAGAAGQSLYVTGTIGSSWLGLKLLQDQETAARFSLSDSDSARLIQRYREPVVPMPQTLAASVGKLACAAMDVSDGLLMDLGRLCALAGCGAQIEADAIPLDPAARRLVDEGRIRLIDLLSGGDDYCVLFTADAVDGETLIAQGWHGPTPVRIGTLIEGQGIVLKTAQGPIPVEGLGHDHFASTGGAGR